MCYEKVFCLVSMVSLKAQTKRTEARGKTMRETIAAQLSHFLTIQEATKA